MENLVQNLLGGGPQRQQYQDFVQRYEQGHPAQGYSGQEVMQNYQQVAPQLPTDVYQQSAQQAFERLSPQERAEFAQFLQQRAQQQNVSLTPMAPGGSPDPSQLAQMATQVHQQHPGLLGQLLGGVGGGGQSNPGTNQPGSILENPVAKAALAGIAAMALKNMMQRRAA